MSSEKEKAPSQSLSALQIIQVMVAVVAVGISIMTYAHATFLTKEVAAEKGKYREEQITGIRKDVSGMIDAFKEHKKWLQDNWHKRHPSP